MENPADTPMYTDIAKQVLQFDLASLFTLVSLSAVICAVGTPFVSAWAPFQRQAVGSVTLSYFIGFAIGWQITVMQRKRILRLCGPRVANVKSEHRYFAKRPLLKATLLSAMLSLQMWPLLTAAFHASKFASSPWIGFWFPVLPVIAEILNSSSSLSGDVRSKTSSPLSLTTIIRSESASKSAYPFSYCPPFHLRFPSFESIQAKMELSKP